MKYWPEKLGELLASMHAFAAFCICTVSTINICLDNVYNIEQDVCLIVSDVDRKRSTPGEPY